MVSSKHGTTSYLVVKGRGHVLIDCGPTVPYVCERMGINLGKINCMHITHSHADHTSGIGKVLVHNRYMRGVDGEKMHLLCDESWAKSLWEKTLCGDLSTHDSADSNQASPDSWYEVVKPKVLSKRSSLFEWGDLKIETFRTMHAPATSDRWETSAWSTGVLIDDKVWYSCDTKFDYDLINMYADRAEVLIHDTASGASPVHASLDELTTLQKEIKGRMWLTHYGDEWVENDQPSEQANCLVQERGFMGLAFTGMKIQF